jgi:beta-lactamase regulating signal transducer with metallopeptidase domain
MELSCDEMVIRGMTSDKRKLYAMALSSLAIGLKTGFTGFGGSAVKTRIMNIIVYKPVSLIMAVITGVLCITVSCMLITNPIL